MNTNYNHHTNGHSNHNDHNNYKYYGTNMNQNGHSHYRNNDKNEFPSYPTKLLSAQRKIQRYDAKLASIENNTSKELRKEIERLEMEQQFKLQLLNQFKSDDSNDINDLYQPQIETLQSQQKQNMNEFHEFCLKELEKTKQEIQSMYNHHIVIITHNWL